MQIDKRVPMEVWRKARFFVAHEIREGLYPIDGWFVLKSNLWELRMWIDLTTGESRAAIYPVVDGRTLLEDSSYEMNVFHKFIVNGGIKKWICKDCGKIYENVLFPDDRTLCPKTRIKIERGEF